MDNASAARDESRICPFLHAVAADGALVAPVRWPDQANRCTALGDVAPQSMRQQEYACLASAHVGCPRYLRGVDLIAEIPAPPAGARLQLTPAIVAALLVLSASFALSVGFVVANGGMDLPILPTGNPRAAEASVAPSQVAPPASSASPGPGASSEPSADASIGAVTAAPSVGPSLTPTSSPTVAPSPGSSSDRYALLEPCPDAPDCWTYTVRSGDNLVSIARYFGVPFEVVTELNPWTETTQLIPGQELRLPPPTR